MMQNIIIIALFAAVEYLLWVRIITLLTYFQQDEYDSRRYLFSRNGAFLRMSLFDRNASIVLSLFGGMTIAAHAKGGVVTSYVFLVLIIFLILLIVRRESRYVYKKPLIWTGRATRIYWLTFMLITASLILLHWLIYVLTSYPVVRNMCYLLVFVGSIRCLPMVMVTANLLLTPFQKRLNRQYIEEAQRKLKRVNPVRIGITGSYGKTTVKHILAAVMPLSGPVFYSRGSVNTQLGLTRHIRERLQWGHRYFIAEMGAYAIGSIRKLCSFVQPTYGIVTAVGTSHIERFGNLLNTAQAKSELAEDVCMAGGHVVLDADVLKFAPFQRLQELYKTQITSVGFNGDPEVKIETADFTDSCWNIKLKGRDGIRISYQLPLLGEHNVMNSALGIVMACIIDPSIMHRIPFVMKEMEQIPHRLQKRENRGQPLVLDDSFNSNKEGFKNAVRILAQLACERGGKSILVTPGIVELGTMHDAVHKELGLFCKGTCDTVYVVEPSRIPGFVSALREAEVEYFPVATLSEARQAIFDSGNVNEQDVLLYENDLPDLFENKRWL